MKRGNPPSERLIGRKAPGLEAAAIWDHCGCLLKVQGPGSGCLPAVVRVGGKTVSIPESGGRVLPMRPLLRNRCVRWLIGAALMVLGGTGILLAWASRMDPRDWPGLVAWSQGLRPVRAIRPHDDVRWVSLRRLDLRHHAELLPTLGFNLRTRWPKPERLPAGFDPARMLTNAMNPGLGVRELHRQGITGRGVRVAIVDFNVVGRHPEYSERLVTLHRLEGVSPAQGSMHGPAVLSLLAGRNCGTAPEACVYFVATSDPGGDAAEQAHALDWILEQNCDFPPAERIRVVSISAAPSGPALHPYRNGQLYDEACDRAEAAGVLVIDGTVLRGFVGPCALDPADPEDPGRCRPVLARGRPDYFAGRILCPTSPRTTAEEYGDHVRGYQYCGVQKETLAAAGSSWSMPYAAGVAAMGWQVRPELTPADMRALLRETARVLPGGERIIDPPAFIARLRAGERGEVGRSQGH